MSTYYPTEGFHLPSMHSDARALKRGVAAHQQKSNPVEVFVTPLDQHLMDADKDPMEVFKFPLTIEQYLFIREAKKRGYSSVQIAIECIRTFQGPFLGKTTIKVAGFVDKWLNINDEDVLKFPWLRRIPPLAVPTDLEQELKDEIAIDALSHKSQAAATTKENVKPAGTDAVTIKTVPQQLASSFTAMQISPEIKTEPVDSPKGVFTSKEANKTATSVFDAEPAIPTEATSFFKANPARYPVKAAQAVDNTVRATPHDSPFKVALVAAAPDKVKAIPVNPLPPHLRAQAAAARPAPTAITAGATSTMPASTTAAPKASTSVAPTSPGFTATTPALVPTQALATVTAAPAPATKQPAPTTTTAATVTTQAPAQQKERKKEQVGASMEKFIILSIRRGVDHDTLCEQLKLQWPDKIGHFSDEKVKGAIQRFAISNDTHPELKAPGVEEAQL